MSVGKRIKDRRKELGFSAEQIAKKIGVSPATVYRYESADIMNMKTDKLGPIANALSTTPGYLMGWTDDPSPEAIVPERTEPPRLKVLFDRSRALTDSQLEIVNKLVAEMTKEQFPHDD